MEKEKLPLQLSSVHLREWEAEEAELLACVGLRAWNPVIGLKGYNKGAKQHGQINQQTGRSNSYSGKCVRETNSMWSVHVAL